MAVSILCGYGFGLLLERYRGGRAAKYICGISVGISLCFLLYFKYADFFLQNFNAVAGADFPLLHIALPIGISFYTFQIISYTCLLYTSAKNCFSSWCANDGTAGFGGRGGTNQTG